eukprot:TRINITY_DN60097_c0_g1_i1.p3 TRINITY_DN60097_c0_g1~~TRINITY_DN60097_c0_g1_i1.p3  ORF type:complete len:119 (+),score=2.27 TRINITY_DN60097_c0_g1_i1:254-610(+)
MLFVTYLIPESYTYDFVQIFSIVQKVTFNGIQSKQTVIKLLISLRKLYLQLAMLIFEDFLPVSVSHGLYVFMLVFIVLFMLILLAESNVCFNSLYSTSFSKTHIYYCQQCEKRRMLKF